MNAVDLIIKNANVQLHNETESYEANEVIFCAEQETVTLKFTKSFPIASEGVLNMSFSGNLNDKMKGFYRSKYYTANGDERYGGVTQL